MLVSGCHMFIEKAPVHRSSSGYDTGYSIQLSLRNSTSCGTKDSNRKRLIDGASGTVMAGRLPHLVLKGGRRRLGYGLRWGSGVMMGVGFGKYGRGFELMGGL